MDKNRAAVLAEARSWLGTHYHHRARIKGAGVDCAMLPIAVFSAVGLIEDFDPGPYPADWMLHRDEERYLGHVARYAVRVDRPQAGDLALFRYGRCVSHGGILDADPLTMIHADLKAGCVERAEIARFADRLHSYWSVFRE